MNQGRPNGNTTDKAYDKTKDVYVGLVRTQTYVPNKQESKNGNLDTKDVDGLQC